MTSLSNPSFSPILRLREALVWLEQTLIGYLLAGMVVVQFINVILRKLGGGWFWALELTLLLFLTLILLGMSLIMRQGGHIGIDVIVKLLPAAWQRGVNVLAGAICFIYALAFSYVGYTMFAKFYLSNPMLRRIGSDDLKLPNWIVYGFFSLSFAYLALTVVTETLAVARGKKEALTAGHEAEEAVEEASAGSINAPS